MLDKLDLAQEGLALIVNEAFVNGAAEEWKLAEQFAQQLITTPPRFEKKEAKPMDQAA